MFIDAGEFNKKISIVTVSRNLDADGYETAPTEVLKWAGWAKFSRESGKEAEKNDGDFETIKARFIIRTPPLVVFSRKWFVKYAGENWEITYINDYGDAKKYTEIICERVSNDG